MSQDKNLQGNSIIENAIDKMYSNMSDENLAKVLERIRDRIRERGHFVVAVKAGNEESMELRPVTTPDGNKWFAAFTSFEEELKKKDMIVSGFTAEIAKLFDVALASDEIAGVILNPWDKAIKLSKNMIKIIAGF